MKQRILLVISCVAIVVASVIGLKQFNSEKNAGNDLLMENVVALTAGEVATVTRVYSCVYRMSFREDGKNFVTRYCGDCGEHVATKASGVGNCRL